MTSPNSNSLTPPLTTDPESRLTAARLTVVRLTTAIERKPDVQIAENFASRVAARALAQPLRRRHHAPRFGRAIALFSVPLAALALFVLAPHSAPNLKSLSFDTEVVLLAELAFIGWWIARISPHTSR